MADENLHRDHRKRMQERVKNYGLESLSEHEVLEYLLFFSIPRCDTNPIAHELIRRFGGFCQVLEADEEELTKVPGVGAASARFLHAQLEIARYYNLRKRSAHAVLKDGEAAIRYIAPQFYGKQNEELYAVILDDKNRVIRTEKIGDGLPNSVDVSAPKLARAVLAANGTGVILAHNHPGGVALPSNSDLISTGRMAELLGKLNITLRDHIIVAGEDAISLCDSNRMPFYDPIRGKVEYP